MIAPIKNTGKTSKAGFQPGNPGGPGRPRGPGKETRIRAQLFAATTEKQIKGLISSLFALAEEGDFQAIKLALEYTVGKPEQVIQVLHQQAPDDYLTLPQAIQDLLAARAAAESRLDNEILGAG